MLLGKDANLIKVLELVSRETIVQDKAELMEATVDTEVLQVMILLRKLNVPLSIQFLITLVMKQDMKVVEEQVVLEAQHTEVKVVESSG